LSVKEKVKGSIDFLIAMFYTRIEIGGVVVNQFEKNVQSKRNDAVDSGVGFIVSFGFFATMFVIATVIKLIGS
jgi:YqzM-like protein